MSKKEYRLKDSKAFCLIPWSHLHIWPNGDTYPCCLTPMDYPVGNFQHSTLLELWNSEDIKTMRNNMLNDKKTESCQRCYEMESVGRGSLRKHFNERYEKSYDIVDTTNSDGSVDDLNLVYWDFRFSNICNFRCRSCGPQLSSSWFHDQEKLYPSDDPSKTRQIYYSGGSATKLWSEIEPLFDTVEEIYFAGGEPLLMDEHYRILKKLDEMKKYDVKLKYNTNLSQFVYKNTNVLDLWNKFPVVEIGASLDANHLRGEYMRKGQDWQQTIQNRKDILQHASHIQFFISCTLGIMNSFNIVDFHKEWVDLDLIKIDDFFINILLEAPYLRLQALPDNLKEKVTHLYQDHIDGYISSHNGERVNGHFQSAINFINQKDYSHLLPEFCSITKKLDDIRDENFAEIFPELKELYD